ncbi:MULTISPECIES: ribonuclease HII [unclassified Chelatococcus]|uniref:ribonuclease HII n=1 Tax=unclassified Chelatococcus TaxID=2638111 RepID=UPI001BCD2C11|nr:MULTISPECIES: ribonuclease HII [unclassified Chelatococcus]MBS7698273.1 ribonuclease HII [Chelatococcus sp. YT9]MBX3559131.1 ribonuclease HII [Chelatococcus sp.]
MKRPRRSDSSAVQPVTPDSITLPLVMPDGPTYDRESRLRTRGLWPVAGVDEVGRGPLAGPVVVAAVILDPDHIPDGLADSKILDAAERERLHDIIVTTSHVGIASVSASGIDVMNIRQATLSAMSRALAALPVAPMVALVDGIDRPPAPCEVEAVVKGDANVVSIAAAAIVAKVTRDRMMKRLCGRYPAYGFSRHKGYATAEHRAAIATHGPCPFHRMSFAPLKPSSDAETEALSLAALAV